MTKSWGETTFKGEQIKGSLQRKPTPTIVSDSQKPLRISLCRTTPCRLTQVSILTEANPFSSQAHPAPFCQKPLRHLSGLEAQTLHRKQLGSMTLEATRLHLLAPICSYPGLACDLPFSLPPVFNQFLGFVSGSPCSWSWNHSAPRLLGQPDVHLALAP